MTLSEEERKARKKASQKEYNAKPDVIAKRLEYNANPERKAKMKEYNKRPEVKEKKKEYSERPEVKEKKKSWLKTLGVIQKRRERQQRPEVKAKRRERQQRPEVKARTKARDSTPERIAKKKEYNARPDVKARQQKRRARPEIKAKLVSNAKSYRDNLRMKVNLHYSKIHSNSDVPCCRCCGENSHLEFLSLDHIAGKKEMDSEPELVKLGYSSNFKSTSLSVWIVKNNFPKGFQVLCHNCNQAKGFSKDNKCPHERETNSNS